MFHNKIHQKMDLQLHLVVVLEAVVAVVEEDNMVHQLEDRVDIP